MVRKVIASVLLLSLAVFLVGCNQIPTQSAYADEAASIEVLSSDGAVQSGRVVTVRSSDGTLKKMVVLDRAAAPIRYSEQAPYRRAAYRSTPYRPAVYRRAAVSNVEPVYRKKRSLKKSALIVGGSAGAGALVGGLAKGKKGAAVGAVAGGLGGLAYDLLTRNKN